MKPLLLEEVVQGLRQVSNVLPREYIYFLLQFFADKVFYAIFLLIHIHILNASDTSRIMLERDVELSSSSSNPGSLVMVWSGQLAPV